MRMRCSAPGTLRNLPIWKDLRIGLALCDCPAKALSQRLGEIGSIHDSRERGGRAEVTGTVRHRRHRDKACLDTLDVALPLVVGEEEDLVLAEWTAKGPAILILMKGRALRGEVIPCIEIGIAEELEDVAMKGVCPGLCNDIDDATGKAAILGVHVARENAKFSDGIEVGNDARLLADRLLHAGAVQVVGIIGFALAMDGELTGVGLARRGHGAEATARAAIAGAARRDWGDACLHGKKVCIAATVERDVDDLLALDGLAKLRVGSVNLRAAFRHRDGLRSLLNLQRHIDGERSIDVDLDLAGLRVRSEAVCGYSKLVLSNQDDGKVEYSLSVARRI